MISDISRADNEFGYVQFSKGETETSYSIGRVGTVCRVKNKVLYEDGKNDVLFDGTDRFRINKIVRTLPYFVAEVEIFHDDDPADNNAASELEAEVYSALKYYLRLLPIIDPESKKLKITQAMKKYRPTMFNSLDSDRRSRFSLALCHMMSMNPSIMQCLLQTTDTVKRLNTYNRVIKYMINYHVRDAVSKSLSDDILQKIVELKGLDNSYDEDILPDEAIETKKEESKDEWDISNMQ